MKERIKTILLLILVFISISLTQRVWIQLPKEMTNVFEINKTYSASYDLSDMIAPNKYLLNFGNKNHTLLNDDSKHNIWDISKVILKEVLSSDIIKTEEISKDQYLKYQDERSLVFYFPEKINTYILAKTWDVKKPNKIVDTIPNINDIYIFLGNGDPFFVFSDGERYIISYNKSIDNTLLKNELIQIEEDKNYNYYYSMREKYNVDNDIYFADKIDNLPTVYVSNEMTTLRDDQKNELAEIFFSSDTNYISKIVENNGSTIYEFNNKVLKLNVNGALEYFHPLEEQVLDRNLYISLSTVAEFIMQKTSSQNGMYLSSIEEIESDDNVGYKLTFKYRIRGIPVLLGNREVGDYIQIEVFNNHIKSYKQLTRRETEIDLNNIIEPGNMLSYFYVLDENYDFLEKKYLIYNNKTKEEIGENIVQEVLSAVDDISLSYYDPNLKDKNEKLIGVWAIRMNDKVYAFNAYTGKLVFER